jgi:hypothetical protein
MLERLPWTTLLLALTLLGCPAEDDDTAGDDDTTATGITVRGTIHQLGDFDTAVGDLTVVVANPTPMLINDEDPEALGFAVAAADGSFEVTGIDATGADMGLIMIVDDTESAYLSVATGIHADDYEGWTDGFVVEDQVAFAATAAWVTDTEADLATAGWADSDLFGSGALIGFVTEDDLTPIGDAVVSNVLGGDVYYADAEAPGSGIYDDGAGTPNTATSVVGEGFWVVPEAPVGPWTCEADGYTFGSLMVGSTNDILVLVAFRPEA